MKRIVLFCVGLSLFGGMLAGCNVGTDSEAQQKSKVDQMNAIQKMDPDYQKKQAQRAERGG
jgi:hypothetical protein